MDEGGDSKRWHNVLELSKVLHNLFFNESFCVFIDIGIKIKLITSVPEDVPWLKYES